MLKKVWVNWSHQFECRRVTVVLKVHLLADLPCVNLDVVYEVFDSFGFHAVCSWICNVTSFYLEWKRTADHWSRTTLYIHAFTGWNIWTNEIETCPVFVKLNILLFRPKIIRFTDSSRINYIFDSVIPRVCVPVICILLKV